MNMALVLIHVIAGAIALASGTLALSATKGGNLHRKSGMVFVYSMLVMAGFGAVVAATPHYSLSGEFFPPQRLSVLAGGLTFYLVTTALLTVRRPIKGARWMDVGAMLFGLGVSVYGLKLGFDGLSAPQGMLDGQPTAPGFVFGAVALLAALGDLRLLFTRNVNSPFRIARHLWRMCFALFIAAASFFLGQARVFPKPMQNPALLAIPVLSVLLLMFYWLARVLFTRRYSRTKRAVQ